MKNKQIRKEVIITIGVYILFFLWWYGFAFGLGKGDPKDYNYILGLPEWFFYSCIGGFLMVMLLLMIVIKFFFKDIKLDEGEDNE